MFSRKQVVATLSGVAITMVTGIAYGYLSQRWGPSPDLVAAGERLAAFPDTLGDWVTAESVPIDETTLQMLNCTGYVNRRYVHRTTGDAVAVAVVVGPSGPIAVHTPEICYSSREYDVAESGTPVEIAGSASNRHSFWKATFQPKRPGENNLRVYYAWSDGTSWQAATAPRFQYGPAPMLYKIQVSSGIRTYSQSQVDPAYDFLAELVGSGWAPGATTK